MSLSGEECGLGRHLPCDPGQITLCASISSSIKWGEDNQDTNLTAEGAGGGVVSIK